MQPRNGVEAGHDETESGFGTTPRLPLTGFLVFGLLTFWVYTAYRLGMVLRDHLAERWSEVRPRLEAAGITGDRLDAVRRKGYPEGMALPVAAAVMFALDGLLVIGWFMSWVVVGRTSDYDYAKLMIAVGSSSALFYAATCLLTVWIARRLFHHETAELLIQERGPSVAQRVLAPTAALVARWEQHNNHVALFLILALAMVASPTIGAHMFLTGIGAAYLEWVGMLCFVLAAVFHYWGTKLLAGLFNAHLETEAAQLAPARAASGVREPAAAPPTRSPSATQSQATAGAGGLEPYDGSESFIFVSYKRDDFPRISAALARIRDAGYRLWYDKGIPGGAEWDALIEEKLKGCSMLLYFVSRESVASKYCRREVKYVDQLGKPILSVKLEPVELAHGLEMLLTQYQMVDAANQDFTGEIERSLKYLRLL